MNIDLKEVSLAVGVGGAVMYLLVCAPNWRNQQNDEHNLMLEEHRFRVTIHSEEMNLRSEDAKNRYNAIVNLRTCYQEADYENMRNEQCKRNIDSKVKECLSLGATESVCTSKIKYCDGFSLIQLAELRSISDSKKSDCRMFFSLSTGGNFHQ